MNVPEAVVAISASLGRAGIPHAFGGAIALGYAVDDPRGTVDVDVNVFVPADAARPAFEALPEGIAWDDHHVRLAGRDGQVRVWWEETAVDLFFDYHEIHEAAARHARIVPFAGSDVPVLAPDELAVFKAFFDRGKDWVDIEAMAETGSLDPDAVLDWLRRLLGPDDARVTRFEALVADVAARPPRDPDAGDPVVRLPPAP